MALSLMAALGCRREARPEPTKLLVYCTQPAKPYGKEVVGTLAEASGLEVILAPVSGKDMLTALDGTHAGDFAVVLSKALQAELAERRLSTGATILRQVTVCMVSREPLQLEDLARNGMRLGSGRPKGPLGDAVAAALPEALRQDLDANTVHRSESSEELLRLLKLGALDAVFVWNHPAPPTGLQKQVLQGAGAHCDVTLVGLGCSRLKPAMQQRLLTACTEISPAARGEASK